MALKRSLPFSEIAVFRINIINADNEFKKLKNKVTAHVEICVAGQHIPRIERGIRFMKDRTRCYWVPMPFKKVPKLWLTTVSPWSPLVPTIFQIKMVFPTP